MHPIPAGPQEPAEPMGPAAEAPDMRPEAMRMAPKAETAGPTAAEAVGPGISPAETAGPTAAEAAAADRAPRRRRAGPTAETEESVSEMARMARCLRIRYYCFSLRLGYLHLIWTPPAEKRKRQLDKAAAEAVEAMEAREDRVQATPILAAEAAADMEAPEAMLMMVHRPAELGAEGCSRPAFPRQPSAAVAAADIAAMAQAVTEETAALVASGRQVLPECLASWPSGITGVMLHEI